LTRIGAKEKVAKRKAPKRIFRRLRAASEFKTGKPVSRPPLRELLKKPDQNFYCEVVRSF
jgi:hypothetical protein